MLDSSQIDFCEEAIRAELGAMVESKSLRQPESVNMQFLEYFGKTFEEMKGGATNEKAEERLRNENLVLREEIDRTSMFEEIVGSSRPMSQVLKQVEKVAPSDSTVLILGETGTGKELIARALIVDRSAQPEHSFGLTAQQFRNH